MRGDDIRPAVARRRREELERWASARGAQLVETLVEAPSRAGSSRPWASFINALESVRAGRADAVCIATLEDLHPDVVVQELLLEEARREHVPIVAAGAADAEALSEPCTDARRALIRSVVRDAPAFQNEVRATRAWMRKVGSAEQHAHEVAAMVAFESMQEHELLGARDAYKPSRSHRIVALLRRRREA